MFQFILILKLIVLILYTILKCYTASVGNVVVMYADDSVLYTHWKDAIEVATKLKRAMEKVDE